MNKITNINITYALEVKEMGRWKLLRTGNLNDLTLRKQELKGEKSWKMELIRVVRIFTTVSAALTDRQKVPTWDHHRKERATGQNCPTFR